MNTQILNFVEQMEAKLLNDIVTGNELDHDLYDIATELLENMTKMHMQLFVKHMKLLSTIY